ncbi:hypothetical protein FOZ62_003351 [Perkinsus olseni]|uniref:Uncharacterized protein n=1 Tax=Perkinsus olseni TaxID=32597 RepID=A0A7J6SW13_PEROL|nr:hypothetical protein FOZ62_003351 [Perkinsus olseni]
MHNVNGRQETAGDLQDHRIPGCSTAPQETDLSALRQRLLDLEMDALALRRSSREYVTFDALQKELDEVHRRVRLSSAVTRETPTTPGKFISPEDPIYRSMMVRLEELEHTAMRRSDTSASLGRQQQYDDNGRLALERRVSDLQRVVKSMQQREARPQDNLEMRIRQLEGMVAEMLRVGKNKETFLLDRFEALRDGLSRSLLPFLDEIKLDITSHVGRVKAHHFSAAPMSDRGNSKVGSSRSEEGSCRCCHHRASPSGWDDR